MDDKSKDDGSQSFNIGAIFAQTAVADAAD